MTLEAIWQVLEDGKWVSKRALKEASGVDDVAIDRIINFLSQWAFVDIQLTPEFLVRRRSGVVSPEKTFDLLTEIVQQSSTTRPKAARS